MTGCINYRTVMCINNNNAVINSNYGNFQDLTLLFKTPMGTQKNFFKIRRQFGHIPSKRFTSPDLVTLLNELPQISICIYLLTPWCRVLLEQLTGLQLVKKFPAFHRTRKFITALTSVRHLSLSLASPIQSTYPHPTSWRSILILSTHLRLGLPSGLYLHMDL